MSVPLAPAGPRPDRAGRFEVTLPATRSVRATGMALARAADTPSGAPAGPYLLYERDGHWTFAAGADAEIVLHRDVLRVRHDGGAWDSVPVGDEPLQQVAALLGPAWAYGWASFELSHLLHGSGGPAVDPGGPDDGPLLHLVVARAGARIGDDEVVLSASRESDLDRMAAALDAPDPGPARAPVEHAVDGPPAPAYRAAVASAVRAIHAGEMQKVILSREVPVGHDVDLLATFEAGRAANTPARSFLLDLGGMRAAGFSPETVVEVDGSGVVSTQPLAGTRALAGDPAGDAALRAELLSDPKEIFEHAISVHTSLDELRGVCRDGSVAVTEFMAVRERGSVQHLASRVSGRLREGHNAWHAFGALFPAVTAAGVPKARACASIRRHEGRRGLYSGAVLCTEPDGGLDAALVLRSIFQSGGRTWLRAGAGIVAQSTPEREYEETCEKLRSVSRTLVPGA